MTGWGCIRNENRAMKIPSMFKPQRDDFMPIMAGCAVLILAVPGFLMVLLVPDPGAGGLATLMLVLLGVMAVIGAALVIAGLRACSDPGSVVYRLVHLRVLPPFRRRRLRA